MGFLKIFPNKNSNRVKEFIHEVESIQVFSKKKPRTAEMTKKLLKLNTSITNKLLKFPNEHIEELFLALTKGVNEKDLNNDKIELFDAGLATALIQHKHTFISAPVLQKAYENIVPNNNVHNLIHDAPVSNPLVYQIIKNKEIINKLTHVQIKQTFISAAYTASPYDEKIDFAIIMLNNNFDLINECLNIHKVLIDTLNHLEKFPEIPNKGKIHLKKYLLNAIIFKLKENKNTSIDLSTLENKINASSINKPSNFSSIISNNDSFKNTSIFEIQNIFNVSLNLSNDYKPKEVNFHRNTEQKSEKEIALKIFQQHSEKLTDKQKQAAFSKSIEISIHKNLFFPELAFEILLKSPQSLVNNPFLIERALMNSTNINSKGSLFDNRIAVELIYFINNNNIKLNFEITKNIYTKITNRMQINRKELLTLSQDIFVILCKIDSSKVENLVMYY